ncbi:MAG: hypothetical protein JST49_15720 [Bacteroidetes bacterium]|nr:hypothetical protein [Bacteroidota bacterium]
MEKTILIPIDFNVECLNTLKLALRRNEDNLNTIVLMYTHVSSSSITDLLFSPQHKVLDAMRTKEFDDALAIIENRFERSIKHIKLRMFSGYNISAFDMFLKGNKVDEIYVPKAYGLNPPTGFDPLPLIQKSTLPVYEINWESNAIVYPIHQLGPLFSN